MKLVTIRDLRNFGGVVLDRVQAGEALTVTRGGTPVAELRPLPRAALARETLVERWRRLPMVNDRQLREDLDLILDGTL